MDVDALLAHMQAAARDAAAYLATRARDRASLLWQQKGAADFVSEADLGSEALLRARLLGVVPGVPAHLPIAMRAEEGSPDAVAGAGLTWVVDPLDGTTNFLHGFPWYAVSIAALLDGVPIAGVVQNAATGETFAAARGRGATRDGASLRVSTIDDPARALIGTGFPFSHASHIAPYLAALPPIMAATAGLRRAGAAALDLCDVAGGRFDAFFELRLAPWDFAAGALIAVEAGAVVTDLHGAPLRHAHSSVCAGNPAMHAWLLPLLAPALPALE